MFFLTSLGFIQALETNPSMNLSMVLEDESRGKKSQEQLEEPQAHSSLLIPDEGSTELVKTEEVETEAGMARTERRRTRRRLAQQRASLTKKFFKLNTGQNGQGNLGPEASGRGTGEQSPNQ